MQLVTGGMKTYMRRQPLVRERTPNFHILALCVYHLIETAGGGNVKGGSVTAYV
jgi:hypothetical protein